MARIGIDARPLASPTTGIGRYTKALVERIIESDHEWFLYTNKKLLHDFSSFPSVTIRNANLGIGALSSLVAQILFPVWGRKDKLDIFWSPRHHLPLLMPREVRQVVTIHDLVWQRCPETMPFLGLQLERLLMPASLSRAHKIISVSNSTALDISELYPGCEDKLETIYEAPFIPMSETSPVLGNYFLFVGTLEPRKNLEGLLKAYRLYVDQVMEPLPLKVCGAKGWGLPRLTSVINSLQLQGHVEVLGYVDDEELPSLYRGARALLMPSLYEGFGLPIVEAFSQGTPVVTSNKGAMSEVAGRAAIGVDPLDIEDISSALIGLSRNNLMVLELQRLALQRARQFSWDRAGASTMNAFELLLENETAQGA